MLTRTPGRRRSVTGWEAALGLAGLVALAAGGEFVVMGAAHLARRLGLSPLLIGVTVVSLGTSAPELAVSVDAALAGKAEVSVGNVVGSNLLNTLVVLGVSSLIVPLVVTQRLVWWDVPIMIGATVLVLGLGWDGNLGAVDGGILLVLLATYLVVATLLSPREGAAVQREYESEFGEAAGMTLPRSLLVAAMGLVLLIVGADFFVEAAVALARGLGVSELVISLTVVAIGTSLPELVTAVVAALRGEDDIAVGNVVGSNIMNLLLILGLAALLATGGLAVAPEILTFDLPMCTAAAVACLPIFWTGHRMERVEGGVFVLAYTAYSSVLVLSALGSPAAASARAALYFGVGPLTLLTIGWSVVRARRL